MPRQRAYDLPRSCARHLAVPVLWAILFLQFVTGHRLLSHDSLEFNYENAFFNSQAFRSGHWPWWNPYLYSGFPQVADPQAMVFSPLLALLMAMAEQPGVAWFDVAVLLHVLAGGIAVRLLCRSYGLSTLSWLLAAIVFMAGGVASARLQHSAFIVGYAYFPWVLYLVRRAFATLERVDFAVLGIVAGFFLVHLVQSTWLLGVLALAYAALELGRARRAGRSGAIIRRSALAIALAAAIAGLQIAATFALIPLSMRQPFSFETVRAASIAPKMLWTLLWPNVFGTLDGDYAGSGDPTESYFFIGVLPLLLIVVFFVRMLTERTQRIDVLLFAAFLVLSGAYVLGANTPLYRILYDVLPGVTWFRRPSDAAFLFNFCAAMLTAFAASALLGSADRPARIGLAPVVFGVAACWYALLAWAEPSTGHTTPILLAGTIALACVLLTATGPARLKRRIIVTGSTLLLLVDMRAFNLPNRLNSRDTDAARFFTSPGPLASRMRQDALRLGSDLPFRIEPIMAGPLWATGPVVLGLSSTQGYNPLRLRRYSEVFGAQESALTPRPFTSHLPSLDSPLFDLAGVRYVVTPIPLAALTSGEGSAHFERIATEGTNVLWRNRFAYERILTPRNATIVAAPADHRLLEGIDFRQTVLIHPQPGAAAEAARRVERCRARAEVTGTTFSANDIAISTSSPDEAWIVLSELDFPGWIATVDGIETPIWRANVLYRAVCVPRGDHHLRFHFDVWRFVLSGFRVGGTAGRQGG